MSDQETVSTKSLGGVQDSERTPNADVSLNACCNYLKSRLPTLLDIPANDNKKGLKKLNLQRAINAMSLHQWNLFWHGFWAWTVDSMDFFCVSITASDIARDLNTDVTNITWGITLVLMLRSVGSIIFGYCGDRWGRKWPL